MHPNKNNIVLHVILNVEQIMQSNIIFFLLEIRKINVDDNFNTRIKTTGNMILYTYYLYIFTINKKR